MIQERLIAAVLASVLWLIPGGRADTSRAWAEPAMISVTEAESGKLIQLAQDQRLEVRLSAQLGTGYSWALAPDSGALVKVIDTRIEGRADAPGAAETQIFILQPNRNGRGTVQFIYRQPWRTDRSSARTFSLELAIGPNVGR